ncbi:MAG: TerB family tellurite resistance protein, partial [Betaproteobacteria bacterium]
EQLALRQGVAALLYEMSRIDSQVLAEESSAARAALGELFGMTDQRARELIQEAGDPANRLTSYHEPLSAINRVFDPAAKIRLVEHLWRIAFADSTLDPNEDHLVRKISDLLYVPHVQCMLARQRARDGAAKR